MTDNDGDVAALKTKYADYLNSEDIVIHFDEDMTAPTLEPQLLKANDRKTVNDILGKDFNNDDDLLHYMKHNKTECALAFLETDIAWKIPSYIESAIE